MDDFVVVLTTAGSRDEGDRLASALVDQRLAACVQLAPVASWYRWEGAVTKADEVLLVIKTRATLFDAVARAVEAAHSYEVPEIVQVPITSGSAPYLAWLTANTTP